MLTKSAVIRFQEKYTIDVLAPVGLVQGNGYVGLYTRMKLNALSVLAVNAQNMNSSISSASTTVSQNSNLENLDKFFAALDIVAAKQRISSSTIVVLKEQAMKRIATTTDMRATFLKLVQNNSHQTIEYNSFVNRVLATMERAFGSVFMPGRAHATVGVPFGGAILYAFLCDGGVWNITLSPLPPLYPVLLAYESGSQAFLSYNIPITHWLLGEYEPVPMAYCWVGIVPYPSEGLITPMVGSSTL